MKKKIITGFIYGALGVVFSYLVANFLTYFVLWLFQSFIFSEKTSDSFQLYFPLIYFIFSFLVVEVLAVYKGLSYEASLKMEQQVSSGKKSIRWIILTSFFLFIFCALIFVKTENSLKDLNDEARRKQMAELVPDIIDVQMQQKDEGIDVTIEVEAIEKSTINLTLTLFTTKNFVTSLLQQSETIALGTEDQKVEFYFPFADLEEYFRKELVAHIPDFQENKDFEEMIVFEAESKLIDSEALSQDSWDDLDFEEKVFKAAASVLFRCSKEKCQFIQE